ncbi:hypothetical protein AKJ16_DCAP17046, partial [Drosera capensis]
PKPTSFFLPPKPQPFFFATSALLRPVAAATHRALPSHISLTPCFALRIRGDTTWTDSMWHLFQVPYMIESLYGYTCWCGQCWELMENAGRRHRKHRRHQLTLQA